MISKDTRDGAHIHTLYCGTSCVSCYTLVEHLLRVHNIAPTIECHPPRFATIPTRQGTKTRIQGQAGLRYLPSPCPTRWPKEALSKGCYIRYV